MQAFINHRHSCYLDSLLVAMYVGMDDFDILWERPCTNFASCLRRQVEKLHNPTPHMTTAELRKQMGGQWDDGSVQSAVDCFHAILDLCGVSELGFQNEKVVRLPRADKPPEIDIARLEGFRAHLAVAGIHDSLADVFSTVEHSDLPTSEYESIETVLEITHAPMLVFEVGRNHSNARVAYGVGYRPITLRVGPEDYLLCGIVCRKHAHYVSFVWKDDQWLIYDDMRGDLLPCAHPELSDFPPSRYGEMFFYK